ncbi:MAG: RNase adapter RapZ [Epulopiscium sp.]|mgnify:CR=1 FL=1|nr:RNase adapter RapZ [Candidatus Epulonipiscium sp.]
MRFVIVTGMSGAGKTTVIKILEDIGFFCVDNLPPALIPKMAEVCFNPGSQITQVALGIDIRGGDLFSELFAGLDSLKEKGYDYEILFLDASDEVLIKRYKETRRKHPLAQDDRLTVGIEKERAMLQEVKQKANYILDTTYILTRELKGEIQKIFLEGSKFDNLVINILSFGFKYGIPNDSDLVFDVRFIPNPYYIPEMRSQTGNDPQVQHYVLQWEETKKFMEKLEDMVSFLIPYYVKEGKNQLVVSIGCTGGKHRSVTLANELYHFLRSRRNSVMIQHRDIEKDQKWGK